MQSGSFGSTTAPPAATPPAAAAQGAEDGRASPKANALYEPLIDAYFRIESALAQDQTDGLDAQVAEADRRLDALAQAAPTAAQADDRAHLAALKAALAPLQGASLDQARVRFGELSAQLIPFLSERRLALKDRLYLLKCPMWTKSPDVWVQRSERVENPFLGSSMPTCGSRLDVWGPAP